MHFGKSQHFRAVNTHHDGEERAKQAFETPITDRKGRGGKQESIFVLVKLIFYQMFTEEVDTRFIWNYYFFQMLGGSWLVWEEMRWSQRSHLRRLWKFLHFSVVFCAGFMPGALLPRCHPPFHLPIIIDCLICIRLYPHTSVHPSVCLPIWFLTACHVPGNSPRLLPSTCPFSTYSSSSRQELLIASYVPGTVLGPRNPVWEII